MKEISPSLSLSLSKLIFLLINISKKQTHQQSQEIVSEKQFLIDTTERSLLRVIIKNEFHCSYLFADDVIHMICCIISLQEYHFFSPLAHLEKLRMMDCYRDSP